MSTEIVVINWNNRRETLECLAAVESQLGDVPGATITVVDNGSSDGSVTAIAHRFPTVRLYALPVNRGFTGGIAAAVAGSNAEKIILLNNDAVPEPGWLAALVTAIDQAPPDVIAIAGRIVDPEAKRIDFVGGVLTFDGHALQNGFGDPVGTRREPERGEELLFACGGNMIVRREPFVSIGGFDDDYFAYLEDVDFGWRSWIAGHRILFEPHATVRHAASTTSNRLGDFERGVLFERNALQTALKNLEDLPGDGAAVLLTYLHRLHHYATTRNDEARELTRPFGAPATHSAPSSKRLRVLRKLMRRPFLAGFDDPLTTMQFRALDWIFKHQESIATKRSAVQARRVRSDAEIFERFPMTIVPTYPGDDTLLHGPLFDAFRPKLRTERRNLSDIIRR